MAALSAYGLATSVVIYLLGMITSVLIARALGPSGRGEYFVPVTAAMIAFQLASLGLPEAQFRLWSRREAREPELVLTGIVASALFGAVGAFATWMIYEADVGRAFTSVPEIPMLIAVSILPFMIHNSLLNTFLAIKERLVFVNTSRLVGALVQAGGALFLYGIDRLTVTAVVALWAATFAVPWLARIGLLVGERAPQGAFSGRIFARQTSLGVRLLPSALFLYLNLRLDIFIVAHFEGLTAVGLYSVAVIFGELVWLVTDSLTQAIIHRQANEPDELAISITERALRMNLLLAVCGGIGIAIAAQIGLPLIYGEAFAEAVDLVWLLVPAAAAMAEWRTVAPMVTRFLDPKVLPAIAVIALVVNVGANLLLVPAWGAAGAAVASSAAYSTGAFLAMAAFTRRAKIQARRFIPRRGDFRDLMRFTRPSVLQAEILGVFTARHETPS